MQRIRFLMVLLAPGWMLCAQDQPKPTEPAPAPAPAAEVPAFVLPTDNRALLEGKPEDFYQFIDRSVDKTTVQVWEGGQFGFVRNPTTLKSGEQLYTRFHEGLDIKPVHRDAKDEPTDEVRSMCKGEVVHCSDVPGRSNYGRYIVIKHDWGEGPFCSLYAHLSQIKCKEGDRVEAGTPIGVMGHTGVGIDRRRSHTHVELCLLLSSRFSAWHDAQTATLNYHGIWNGLNLVGFDLSQLYLTRAKDPKASIIAMVKGSPEHFRVAVPGTAEMELLQNYPWLCTTTVPKEKPKSWLVTFTPWGLPVKIEPSDQAVDDLKLVWVKESTLPQYSLTRGLVSGFTGKTFLTNDGQSYVRLATGLFTPKVRTATPVQKVKPGVILKKKTKK